MPLPLIAITLGDPAGIGPEISLKAALDAGVRGVAGLVLVGEASVANNSYEKDTYPPSQWEEGLAQARRTGFAILDTAISAKPPALGSATADGGRAAFRAIEAAIELALAGKVDAVTTAPINKHALHLAGVNFPGHTEIFGSYTRSPSFAMMMYSERMAVGLVTCHQSLMSVGPELTAARIVEVGLLLSHAVTSIRGVAPRMAVLGLNPHAGEERLFGNEDADAVAPAVAELRRLGIDAEGPIPPDAGFTKRALSRYGAHLCLYHDQGLIPFKMLCFDEGVNVTMGLPFPRTSPDHGTAYDIAGQGIADPSSMIAAITLAAKLARP